MCGWLRPSGDCRGRFGTVSTARYEGDNVDIFAMYVAPRNGNANGVGECEASRQCASVDYTALQSSSGTTTSSATTHMRTSGITLCSIPVGQSDRCSYDEGHVSGVKQAIWSVRHR